MTRTHRYEVVGVFENPMFPKGRNIMSYSANGFMEVYEAAKTAGLKKMIKTSRWNISEEPEPCPVIDINAGKYLN